MEELGVSAATLDAYGAVSEETAAEMAEGLAKKTGSDLCVSVTGVAGPDPSEGKPVGLIYIGLTYKGQTRVTQVQRHNSSRKWNRNYAVLTMLHEIYQEIK